MNRRRLRQFAWYLGFLLLIVGLLLALTWREIYRQRLNRDLITAVKANDARQVISLLDRGADANTYDDPPRKLSLWQMLQEALRHRNSPASKAPSALQLALDWRPGPGSNERPTIQDSPLIRALVHHGARLGAREILARMARTYAFCSSYHDTGNVTYKANVRSFQMDFMRPNRFRFEFTHGWKFRGCIWENDRGAFSWYSFQQERQASLEMTIARAPSVSWGTAETIPGLLMVEQMGWSGWNPSDYDMMRLHGVTRVDGAVCYEVEAKSISPAGTFTTIFCVDTQSYLLRRQVERYQENPLKEVTIRYHPQINLAVDERVFHFTPPKE